MYCTEAYPPAAVYSALTASSKLQHLDIGYCSLPSGVWQHMFPTGRQLPHLQWLRTTDVSCPTGPAAAPEGTRLVSCCPGLQVVYLDGLQYSRGLMDLLQGLSSLSTLYVRPAPGSAEGWEEGMCQLTMLRDLHVEVVEEEGLLLQLTQLRQLTRLHYRSESLCAPLGCHYFIGQCAVGGEPVWRQVLRLHLNHSDSEVAQQAAAALAE